MIKNAAVLFLVAALHFSGVAFAKPEPRKKENEKAPNLLKESVRAEKCAAAEKDLAAATAQYKESLQAMRDCYKKRNASPEAGLNCEIEKTAHDEAQKNEASMKGEYFVRNRCGDAAK